MGFFDAITNFLAPVSKPLVSVSTQLSGEVFDRLGGSHVYSQALARPDVQALGNQLFDVGVIAGGAVAGGAVAAPLLAGVSLPSLGSLGSVAGVVTSLPFPSQQGVEK
jgi:hypothetical protein